MAAVGCENEHELCDENEFLRKKGYSWSREETLMLISLYEEMKELFKNVNYKKKQVWEMIAARMKSESSSSPRADQCEGKWKALTLAFRKCEDHNSQSGNDRRECPFYKELAEVYGYRPNVRPYATASSSGNGDSTRSPLTPKKIDDEEVSPCTKKRYSDAGTSSSKLEKTPKKARLGSSERNKNDCLSWLKEYTEEKRRERAAQEERAQQQHHEKMQLLSGLLNVMKDLNK